jgi:putative Mg2+ transporter-C (MgtC) family protein
MIFSVATVGSLDLVGRLMLAALLGGLLGAERELDGQDAGLRTHLLLALGAALFGATSVGAFDGFIADPSETNVTVDVSRIASYVAAGIGFIGGGTILKHRGRVSGITTATSLWTTAAVGLAAGLGFWIGSLTTALVALVALRALKPLSTWLANRAKSANE